MTQFREFSQGSIAAALRKHLVPSDDEARSGAEHLWVACLEQRQPQDIDDLAALADDMSVEYCDDVADSETLEAYLTGLGGFLGEFMGAADRDAVILAFRAEEPLPDSFYTSSD